MSDDGRTLTVEFEGSGCPFEDVPWVGRRGDELQVGIYRVARADPLPTRVACTLAVFRRTYQLALPEPFTGSTMRDLNGGVLVLD